MILVADPTIIGVSLNDRQEAPTGLHAVTVTKAAEAHRFSVPIATLRHNNGTLTLSQNDSEVQSCALPLKDDQLSQLLRKVNTLTGQVQAHSTGDALVIESLIAGTRGALGLHIDGAAVPVTLLCSPSDADITVNGRPMISVGNQVSGVEGLDILARKTGRTNVTVAEARVPRWVFPLVLSYLILLPILALLYKVNPGRIFRGIPKDIGPAPISVLFFGAAFGFVAVFAFIALIDATQATSTRATAPTATIPTASAKLPNTTPTAAPVSQGPGSTQQDGPSSVIVFDIVAFLVGYREETFRNLLKRISDVLLGPGGVGSEPGKTPCTGKTP